MGDAPGQSRSMSNGSGVEWRIAHPPHDNHVVSSVTLVSENDSQCHVNIDIVLPRVIVYAIDPGHSLPTSALYTVLDILWLFTR